MLIIYILELFLSRIFFFDLFRQTKWFFKTKNVRGFIFWSRIFVKFCGKFNTFPTHIVTIAIFYRNSPQGTQKAKNWLRVRKKIGTKLDRRNNFQHKRKIEIVHGLTILVNEIKTMFYIGTQLVVISEMLLVSEFPRLAIVKLLDWLALIEVSHTEWTNERSREDQEGRTQRTTRSKNGMKKNGLSCWLPNKADTK